MKARTKAAKEAKFLGPVNTDTGEWAPGIGSKNPYDRVNQASAWEMFDRSNRYYEQAVAERILHPVYAVQLQQSAHDMRVAAKYITTLKRTQRPVTKAKGRSTHHEPHVEKVHKAAPAPRARRQRA